LNQFDVVVAYTGLEPMTSSARMRPRRRNARKHDATRANGYWHTRAMTQQRPPAYPVYTRPSDGLATASLVLGITAAVLALPLLLTFTQVLGTLLGALPALLGVVALSLGYAARAVGKKTGAGLGASKAGIILGYVAFGLAILPVLYRFSFLLRPNAG
jgi:hypothetical protein